MDSEQREAIGRQLESRIPENAKFTRRGGAGDLTYVDGAYVIDSLNEIFGWDGWEFEHVAHSIESMTQIPSGEKNAGKWSCVASYVGSLRVTLDSPYDLTKSGAACGSGLSFNAAEAMHFALTEAETDSLKRAARLLGGRLGLELYRKHGNLAIEPVSHEEMDDATMMFMEAISKLHDSSQVEVLSHEIRAAKLSPQSLATLRVAMARKLKELPDA